MNAVEPMQVDAAPENNENSDAVAPFEVDGTPLELETYIQNYSGLNQINRLLFIADHCSELRVEALKLALDVVMITHNIGAYQLIHRKLATYVGGSSAATNNVASSSDGSLAVPDVAVGGIPAPPAPESRAANDPPANAEALQGSEVASMPQYDQQWVENRSKAATLKLEKLDTDLKGYKTNSIKESIRRGCDDLGNHYLDWGDLNNALKCYSRARDYCLNGKQIINMCVNVVMASIHLQHWSHVQSYASKATMTLEYSENTKQAQTMKVALGLAALASKKYADAADHFLQVNLDLSDFSEIMSQNDVAICGGLCALATLDRADLKTRALSSPSFKQFLELEPQLRDAIHKFHTSNYSSSLKTLLNSEKAWLLDMYLSPHVQPLLHLIRQKGMIQYFRPFVKADLNNMAREFDVTVKDLEAELTVLILEGKLNAKIDSYRQTLVAKKVENRYESFKQANGLANDSHWRIRGILLRAATVRADFVVKAPVQGGGGRDDVASSSLFGGVSSLDRASQGGSGNGMNVTPPP